MNVEMRIWVKAAVEGRVVETLVRKSPASLLDCEMKTKKRMVEKD